MNQYNVITTRLTVVPDGEPIFSEYATHVEMQDEAAGAFVELVQVGKLDDAGRNVVRINADEWPAIRGAIDQMLDLIGRLDSQAAEVACDQMIETLDGLGDAADGREG
jgi:hypothetical protein